MANFRKNEVVKSSKSVKASTRNPRGNFSSVRSSRYKQPTALLPIKASFSRVKRYSSLVKNTSDHDVKSRLINDSKNTSSTVKRKVCPVIPIQQGVIGKPVISKGQIQSDQVKNPSIQRVISSSFETNTRTKHKKNSSKVSKITTKCDSVIKRKRKMNKSFNKVPLSQVSGKNYDTKLFLSEDEVKSKKMHPVQRMNDHDIVDDKRSKQVIPKSSSLETSVSLPARNFSISQKNNIKSIKVFQRRAILKDSKKKFCKNAKKSTTPQINKIFRNKKLILSDDVKNSNVCIVALFRNDVSSPFSVITHYQVSLENKLPFNKPGLPKLSDLSPHAQRTISKKRKKNLKNTSKVHSRHSLKDGDKILCNNSKKVLDSEVDKNSLKVFESFKPSPLNISKRERKERSVTTCDNDASFKNDVPLQCSFNADNEDLVEKNILHDSKSSCINNCKTISKKKKNNLRNTSKVHSKHSLKDGDKIVCKNSKKVVLDSELDKNSLKVLKSSELSSSDIKKSEQTDISVTTCDSDASFQIDVPVKCSFKADNQDPVRKNILHDNKFNCISDCKIGTTDSQAFAESNILSLKEEDPLDFTEPLSLLSSSFSEDDVKDVNFSSKISNGCSSLESDIVKKSPEKVKKLINNIKKPKVSKSSKTSSLACKDSLCRLRTKNSIAVCDKDFISNKEDLVHPCISDCSKSSLSNNKKKAKSIKSLSDASKVSVKTNFKQIQKIKPKKIPKKGLKSEKEKRIHDKHLFNNKKEKKVFSSKRNEKKLSSLLCKKKPAKNLKKLSSSKKQLYTESDFYNDPSLENVPLDSLFLSSKYSKIFSPTSSKKTSKSKKNSCKRLLKESDSSSSSSKNSKRDLTARKKQATKSKKDSFGKVLTESDFCSDLSSDDISLKSLVSSSEENSTYKTSVVDSDYEDDWYDPKQFEKFKTIFKYASDIKLELIVNSEMSNKVVDLNFKETSEFIEKFYVPVDSLSSTNEVLPELSKDKTVKKHCKKSPKKKKPIKNEREEFANCLTNEPIVEKFNSMEDMTFADFLRIHQNAVAFMQLAKVKEELQVTFKMVNESLLELSSKEVTSNQKGPTQKINVLDLDYNTDV